MAGGKEAVQKDLAGVQYALVVAANKAGCPFFKVKDEELDDELLPLLRMEKK